MAGWHHRPPAGRAPRHGGAGAAPGWTAAPGVAPAPQQSRPVPAFHAADAYEVSDPDCQPAVRDGGRARLPRIGPSLPPLGFAAPAAPEGGSLFASAHAQGRARPGRLGALRPSADRPG